LLIEIPPAVSADESTLPFETLKSCLDIFDGLEIDRITWASRSHRGLMYQSDGGLIGTQKVDTAVSGEPTLYGIEKTPGPSFTQHHTIGYPAHLVDQTLGPHTISQTVPLTF
jgi:hypothetical protein